MRSYGAIAHRSFGAVKNRVARSETLSWHIAVAVICLLLLLPLTSIFILSLTPDTHIWPHLVRSVLFGEVELWALVLAAVGIICTALSFVEKSHYDRLIGVVFSASGRSDDVVDFFDKYVNRHMFRYCGIAVFFFAVSFMPGAVPETVTLMAGVGGTTLVVGTLTAWLVTMYTFPGKRLFDWLLLIPLAMPTYIIAFCYVELLDYSGTLQTTLRDAFGFHNASDYWFPRIRSESGAIFVMSFVLYPYVYLAARASFIQQSICVLEVARTLGRTPVGTFISVALPLARPALVAGAALALMECLNDIGAVEYFGVNTLTLSIYATWLERSSLSGAAQIASVMLIFVIGLFIAERRARQGQSYHHTTGRYRAISEQSLTGVRGWSASIFCFLPILFGFVLPVCVLVQSAFAFSDDVVSSSFWQAARNSIVLSSTAALVTVAFALVLSYARRVAPSPFIKTMFRLTGLGYAIPGTVVAVGLLIPLASFDNWVDGIFRSVFGLSTGLILSGTTFAIVLAYTVRFLSVSNGNLEAGLQRISPNLDAASRSLGAGSFKTLWRVHLPMLRPALGTAALLVFVDSMKELPATLLLRPFNFDTLATHVYNFASLEQFEEAGLAALMIVAIGLLPVILLSRAIVVGRPGSEESPSFAYRLLRRARKFVR